MIAAILLLFSVFVMLQVYLAFVYLYRYFKRLNKFKKNEKADRISIIIPFKNESQRILPLLKSFNESIIKADCFELIFIDDHSNDNTSERIAKELKVPYTLLLNKLSGKKHALDTGIQIAKNPFILTIDADISFSITYLSSIAYCKKTDLNILPVSMVGETFIQRFSSIEFEWLQLLTFSSNDSKLCNGANLLFNKGLYLASKKLRTDFEIPSGDDIFLLAAAKKMNAGVSRINHTRLKVHTPAPESFSELSKQRQRWMYKMPEVTENTFYAESVILIGLQVMVLGSFLSLFILDHSYFLLIPFLLKFVIEAGVSFLIGSRKKPFFIILALMVHQLLYPILLLIRVFNLFRVKKVDWR